MIPLPEPDVPNTHGGPGSHSTDQLRAYGEAVRADAIQMCIDAVLSAPVKTDRQDQREACANAIRASATPAQLPGVG